MVPLREMHRLMAAHPRCQAKFFLLLDDLVERFFMGVEDYYIGKHRGPHLQDYQLWEDDFASSGEPGLAGIVQ